MTAAALKQRGVSPTWRGRFFFYVKELKQYEKYEDGGCYDSLNDNIILFISSHGIMKQVSETIAENITVRQLRSESVLHRHGITAGLVETGLTLTPSQLLRLGHGAAITIKQICYSCS